MKTKKPQNSAHAKRMEPDGEARVIVTITPIVVVAAQAVLLG